MPEITITLPDATLQQLAAYARGQGLTLDAFLAQALEERPTALRPGAPRAWMPRAEWDALVRGEGCPLCTEVAATEARQEEGYIVADLGISRLRLAVNQFIPGYCVLMCTKHVRELFHLTPEERARYVEDLARALRAIEEVLAPIKMNVQMLGNAVPHLHSHLVPRFYGDPAPSTPIDPNLETHLLTPEEYQERAARLRAAL